MPLNKETKPNQTNYFLHTVHNSNHLFLYILMISDIAILHKWFYFISIISLHTMKWFQVLLTNISYSFY